MGHSDCTSSSMQALLMELKAFLKSSLTSGCSEAMGGHDVQHEQQRVLISAYAAPSDLVGVTDLSCQQKMWNMVTH